MHTDPDCIFCKIVAGQIPCHKVYEDKDVLAFLDIGPLLRGHVLIIPKTHAITIDQLEPDAAAACGRVLPTLAGAVMKATGTSAYNVLQNNGRVANQAVDHVHFHIIPRESERGLGIDWQPGSLSDEQAAELKQAIASALV